MLRLYIFELSGKVSKCAEGELASAPADDRPNSFAHNIFFLLCRLYQSLIATELDIIMILRCAPGVLALCVLCLGVTPGLCLIYSYHNDSLTAFDEGGLQLFRAGREFMGGVGDSLQVREPVGQSRTGKSRNMHSKTSV